MAFASSRPEIAKDPLFQLVKRNTEIAPGVLKEHGKVIIGLHMNTCNQEPAYANTFEDEKPISECRLFIGCSLPPLRFP